MIRSVVRSLSSIPKIKNVQNGSIRFTSALPRPQKRKPVAITWKSAAVTAGVASVFGGFMYYLKFKKDESIRKERERNLGKAAIGGTFELLDGDGNVRKSDEFLGNWLLIYFGFTHCPDICPEEMEKMANVIDRIDKDPELPKIQPVFISVDPLRDTPALVGKYVKEFSSKILGLTGTVDQIQKVCKSYRVYFSAGPKDSDQDYIVDHTIIMYLVNPKGDFIDYYGNNLDAEQVFSSIVYNMTLYDKDNKKGWWAKKT